MKENQSIHIWCDWESTGIWVDEDGHLKNADYGLFVLPEELITRFKYWERWFSDAYAEWSDERNKMDWTLYGAYGLSLAVDTKRFLGEKYRVFYGHPTEKNCVEIILTRRERVAKEEGRVVPIAVLYKK